MGNRKGSANGAGGVGRGQGSPFLPGLEMGQPERQQDFPPSVSVSMFVLILGRRSPRWRWVTQKLFKPGRQKEEPAGWLSPGFSSRSIKHSARALASEASAPNQGSCLCFLWSSIALLASGYCWQPRKGLSGMPCGGLPRPSRSNEVHNLRYKTGFSA